MLPAAFAMVLFALSSVTARRSVRLLGSDTANLARMLLATTLLGLYAHTAGVGFHGPALGWFLASGIIGYGICDTAIFLALPRLGAQLTTLMVQCLSVPVALATEWLWLGTRLTAWQLAAIAIILAGVATALFPARRGARRGAAVPAAVNAGVSPAEVHTTGPGAGALLLGGIGAIGQAVGAVLARHGTQIAREAHAPIDGFGIAYQRIAAGLVFTIGWWLWQRSRRGTAPGTISAPNLRAAWPWTVLNAISGPTLGVACYQWALAIQPTGIVMSITALAPLAVIPLAAWIERERPTVRSVAGGFIAVGGVVWLALQGGK